jgi:hypothetical protein
MKAVSVDRGKPWSRGSWPRAKSPPAASSRTVLPKSCQRICHSDRIQASCELFYLAPQQRRTRPA